MTVDQKRAACAARACRRSSPRRPARQGRSAPGLRRARHRSSDDRGSGVLHELAGAPSGARSPACPARRLRRRPGRTPRGPARGHHNGEHAPVQLVETLLQAAVNRTCGRSATCAATDGPDLRRPRSADPRPPAAKAASSFSTPLIVSRRRRSRVPAGPVGPSRGGSAAARGGSARPHQGCEALVQSCARAARADQGIEVRQRRAGAGECAATAEAGAGGLSRMTSGAVAPEASAPPQSTWLGHGATARGPCRASSPMDSRAGAPISDGLW